MRWLSFLFTVPLFKIRDIDVSQTLKRIHDLVLKKENVERQCKYCINKYTRSVCGTCSVEKESISYGFVISNELETYLEQTEKYFK